MKTKTKEYRLLSLIVYAFFLLVIFGLAFFSFDSYSLLSNTTSHLGAQQSPHAWIMNLVFVCLGLMSIYITFQKKVISEQVLGLLFGISLAMSGIFQHAPLVDLNSVDLFQDQMHSIFASTTGLAFTLLAINHGFISANIQRIISFTMALIAMLLSVAIFSFPQWMGLFQRILFMSAFSWLFFYKD